MTRLLLADRIKSESDSFLAPLRAALSQHYEIRFMSVAPGPELAEAIAWADLVWLEWCWDHAVWATRSGVLGTRPTVLRLHSIEALQTDFPARVDWSRINHLITVSSDLESVLLERFQAVGNVPRRSVVPNGIDPVRFPLAAPDRFRVGWVGHLEPKKNPMLMVQIAHALHLADSRYHFDVAGAFTDVRTHRYLREIVPALGLAGAIQFHGMVADMPAWYADKGVLLSTSMYESFGLNIGEAMAVGAFPVVHAFPGSERLWPEECLFASVAEAVALIRSAKSGLYREWVLNRYGLNQQIAAVLGVLTTLKTHS